LHFIALATIPFDQFVRVYTPCIPAKFLHVCAINGGEISLVYDTEPASGRFLPEEWFQQRKIDSEALLLCYDDGAGQGKGIGGLYPEVEKKPETAADDNKKRPRSES
jgi:hypothetical protein